MSSPIWLTVGTFLASLVAALVSIANFIRERDRKFVEFEMQDLRDLRAHLSALEKNIYDFGSKNSAEIHGICSQILSLLENEKDSEFISVINRINNMKFTLDTLQLNTEILKKYHELKAPTLRAKWAFIKNRSNRLI